MLFVAEPAVSVKELAGDVTESGEIAEDFVENVTSFGALVGFVVESAFNVISCCVGAG